MYSLWWDIIRKKNGRIYWSGQISKNKSVRERFFTKSYPVQKPVHKPANFYILPKIHKLYEYLPPGRPISGKCNIINKYISGLVDLTQILKPCMSLLPDVPFDTMHYTTILELWKADVTSLSDDISSPWTRKRALPEAPKPEL